VIVQAEIATEITVQSAVVDAKTVIVLVRAMIQIALAREKNRMTSALVVVPQTVTVHAILCVISIRVIKTHVWKKMKKEIMCVLILVTAIVIASCRYVVRTNVLISSARVPIVVATNAHLINALGIAMA